MAYLKAQQIGTEVHYPVPMHPQECFADFGHYAGIFLYSEQAALETVALPIYPELTDKMTTAVVDTIAEFFQARACAV